jgi:hypothetical protein
VWCGGKLTEQRPLRGSFRYSATRMTAISDHMEQHNDDPRLFVWALKAGNILRMWSAPGPP